MVRPAGPVEPPVHPPLHPTAHGWRLHVSDPQLITLGASGIIVSALVLARIHRTTRRQRTALPANG